MQDSAWRRTESVSTSRGGTHRSYIGAPHGVGRRRPARARARRQWEQHVGVDHDERRAGAGAAAATALRSQTTCVSPRIAARPLHLRQLRGSQQARGLITPARREGGGARARAVSVNFNSRQQRRTDLVSGVVSSSRARRQLRGGGELTRSRAGARAGVHARTGRNRGSAGARRRRDVEAVVLDREGPLGGVHLDGRAVVLEEAALALGLVAEEESAAAPSCAVLLLVLLDLAQLARVRGRAPPGTTRPSSRWSATSSPAARPCARALARALRAARPCARRRWARGARAHARARAAAAAP